VSHSVSLDLLEWTRILSRARTRVTVPLLGTVVYYTDYCIPPTSPPPRGGGQIEERQTYNKQIMKERRTKI